MLALKKFLPLLSLDAGVSAALLLEAVILHSRRATLTLSSLVFPSAKPRSLKLW